MQSSPLVGRFSISELIKAGAIAAHKDGNFGSLYPKVDDFVGDGVPLLTAKVLNGGRIDFSSAQKLRPEKAAELPYGFIRPGDVLLSHNATVGRVAVVPAFTGQAMIGTSLTYFRLDQSRLLPRYLACFFESRDFQNQLASVMGLSTRNQVPITAQRQLEVEVPPIAIQSELSNFVTAIDERTSLLRQTNATLESIAQALFKSWFIDFDPVRAKVEGCEPESMDVATAALFPNEFEKSELGLIPKGWRAGSLVELSSLNSASWTARRAPGEVAYVDLAGVKANAFEPPQRLAFADAPSRARRVLRAGDTLIGTVRPGNRSFGYIAEVEPGLTGSTGFAVLSPVTATAAAFVYLAATRDDNIERLAALADGGAYPAVRPELIQATACVLPLQNVLEAFHAVSSPLLASIAANTQRARVLAEIRDTLLPRLISGKLRVPEAQEQLEGAMA